MFPRWLPPATVVAATAGPISHYLLWSRGEWDGEFHKVVPWIGAAQVLEFLLLRWLGQSLIQSIVLLSLLAAAYVITLFSSIAIYRLLLHPTRKFPGPFWARLSSWWRVRAFLRHHEQAYAVTHELHEKYGDIVRAGTVTLLD
jgi:hypothetical protein